jgi:hypothetical protein
MLDGINGQAGSYVIVILIIFVINKIFLPLSIILIVATIFILILNFNNKLYLGSTGTLVLGFLISNLFIKSHNIYEVFYADEIFLIMIIPGLDLVRLAFTRLLNRKHPFKPDRNHIHHLVINNFSFIYSFFFMQVILIFPYLLFLILKNFILTFIIVLFTYIFLIYFLKKNEKN